MDDKTSILLSIFYDFIDNTAVLCDIMMQSEINLLALPSKKSEKSHSSSSKSICFCRGQRHRSSLLKDDQCTGWLSMDRRTSFRLPACFSLKARIICDQFFSIFREVVWE